MFLKGVAGAPQTIIAKDLAAAECFNGDLRSGLGTLPAGTILEYSGAELSPGTTAPFGLLADDTGGGGPAMVYRKGTFPREAIEAANGLEIPADGPLDRALVDLGIHLEPPAAGA